MSKKIIVTEEQIANLIVEESLAYLYNPYSNKIKSSEESLNNLLLNYGKVMINIKNGRDFYVYYAKGISNVIGKQYCICRIIGMDGNPNGPIYVKPMELFKNKY